jgi:hypothetical protein
VIHWQVEAQWEFLVSAASELGILAAELGVQEKIDLHGFERI